MVSLSVFLISLSILLQTPSPTVAAVSPNEKKILVELYNSTNGDSWLDKTGWVDHGTTDPCDDGWFGITCNNGKTGVAGLQLSLNNLKGSIPVSIGNLTQLTFIMITNNSLTGAIPAAIGNLSQLEGLWLSSNSLTGSIPSEIGNLSLLKYLGLSNNKLSGAIPHSLTNLNLWPTNGLNLNNNCLNTNVTQAISDYIFEKSKWYGDWKTTQGQGCFPWPMYLPAITGPKK